MVLKKINAEVVCDNTGLPAKYKDLVKQMEYGPNGLYWTGKMVDKQFKDDPNPQNLAADATDKQKPLPDTRPWQPPRAPNPPNNLKVNATPESTKISIIWDAVNNADYYNVIWEWGDSEYRDLWFFQTQTLELANNKGLDTNTIFPLINTNSFIIGGENDIIYSEPLLPNTTYRISVMSVSSPVKRVLYNNAYTGVIEKEWSFYSSAPTQIKDCLTITTGDADAFYRSNQSIISY